jgi:hypothetical protein
LFVLDLLSYHACTLYLTLTELLDLPSNASYAAVYAEQQRVQHQLDECAERIKHVDQFRDGLSRELDRKTKQLDLREQVRLILFSFLY